MCARRLQNSRIQPIPGWSRHNYVTVVRCVPKEYQTGKRMTAYDQLQTFELAENEAARTHR